MVRTDEEAVLRAYRTLSAQRRREVAAASSPELRARLVAVEREMALGRSPGAMAAVLTEGREMQTRHLDLIDGLLSGSRQGSRRGCC